ncbi:amidase [Bradyrhizobium yuanmingense]|uniref:amidase n=1 Tax=Bradyrhizobium yuanmingense TaxID=108015 RepID=UPI000FE3908A|nr:amidase [Bradyrhizobium yuanmingense]TGN84333.1 amidase [Bradyrhizobium yuanmingense]
MSDAPGLAPSTGILALSAVDAIAEIRKGHLSPLDVVDAAIDRIEATDAGINAIPVRCFEAARGEARRLMEKKAAGEDWPLLCGLPLAVKDNTDVAGVPTSGGSALTARGAPEISNPAIDRLQRNGAIVVGKSNLSELGGANTTNALFGATRNPFFPALTAGGSSGGSAAALAAHQVYLAHGNDVGGSLRTPAAFCGVAGLRPTPGLVPRKPLSDPFDTVFVEGPMARTIPDLALMLDAMAGFHPPDLLSREHPASFRNAAARPGWAGRIAVSEDLGLLPVDHDIRSAFRGAIDRLQPAGCRVSETAPDLAGLPRVIRALRGLAYLATWGRLWPQSRAAFTPEVAGDIAHGESLSATDIAAAMEQRAAIYRRMQDFFGDIDILICPTVQVAPFPVEIMWPAEIEGTASKIYIDWIMITYVWSILGCPALAVPAGRDGAGMPVSLQVVGPPHSEERLISFAARIEQAFSSPS